MIPAFLLLIWAYLSLVSTIHIFLANTLFYEYLNIFLLTGLSFFCNDEYSCAVTPQVRQTGNRLSGLAGTAYASLLT